jgi:hypothetical protein
MSLWRNHDFLREIKDSVSFAQYKRLIKIVQDEFYLLDMKYEDLVFKICGSTKNVYTISFDKSENTLKCNCPDMCSHCITHSCLCKHIVFVLLRVLKYYDVDIYKSLKWNEEKMAPYFEKLNANKGLLQDNLITNQELTEKYKSQVNTDSKKEKNDINDKFSAGPRRACSDADPLDLSTKKKMIPCNIFDEDYECAICYDIMDIKDDVEKFVGCPTCKHSFHKLCIKKWLENAVHKNCVYCRSNIWSEYNKKQVEEYIKLV